jgi:hypothetical protein
VAIVLIDEREVAVVWLAVLAYPPNGDNREGRKRQQFAEALRTTLARQLPVAERPQGLPRGRVVERRIRMGLHQIKTGALPAAWILLCATHDRARSDEEWHSSAPTYAAERLQGLIDAKLMKRGLRSTPRDPEQRANVLHRIWKRHRCVLHLALPLLDRLRSKSLSDVLSDLDWVAPAWDEAEVWRCVIPQRYPRIRPDELVPMCHFLKLGNG